MTDIETLRWTAKNLLPRYQSDWLTKGMEILRKDFEQIGETFPEGIDIRVDWPDRGISPSWFGLYHRDTWDDEVFRRIYISPTVDGLLALDILVHELVHAATEEDPGHGERFKEIAAAIGIDVKGTASGAEEVLMQRLRDIQETLGSYPVVFDCLEAA